MATNKVQDGKVLRLTVGATFDSGDVAVVGNALRGVGITDYESGDAKASIEMGGVYDLSVTAADDAGDTTVVVGDRLYTDGTTITKKRSGKFLGVALEAIAVSGATATINVLVGLPTGPDQTSHTVVAAGIHAVTDSPLAATTTIAITGALATDVALVTIHTNGGSPKLSIVSAVSQASPAGILVTADGTFTAGDKLNYALLRAAL
jgi:predicted RecA/RadA family phage recombinase